MQSWFGAEVQLGIVVLLVSVPVVGALACVIAYGIIADPFDYHQR